MRTKSSEDHPEQQTPPRLRRFAAALAAVLALVLASTVAVASAGTEPADPTPQAATKAVGITYVGGPGHPGPVWAGTWKNPTRGFCIDFSKHSPSNAGTEKLTGAIPGMTDEQTAVIKFIANAYAQTDSPKEAAHAQFAIWKVEADPDFATWYSAADITAKDRKAVTSIIDRARHAGYRVKVGATKVQVGQTGKGTVAFVGDADQAEGMPVALTATGAVIRTVNGLKKTTGALKPKGMTFTYERTGAGRVDIKAVLSVPSSELGALSVTDADHQRTLGGAYVTPAEALFGYQLTPGQPTVTSRCDTDCNGIATLTFKACNAAGADAVRWTQTVGGQVVATLAAAGGRCATKTAAVADGQEVASAYCYTASVGGACRTDTVPVPKPYAVVCPPWAKAVYALSCNCDADGGGTVTFTTPEGSIRFYRGFVAVTTKGKTTTRQADLFDGEPTQVQLDPVPDGSEVAVSFRAYKDPQRKVPLGDRHTLVRVTVGG